jgi:hypothetical protein
MQRKSIFVSAFISTLLCASTLCKPADVPKKADQQAAMNLQPTAPSLALSPAVITVKAQPGASSTHSLTMTNLTHNQFKFVLEAFDVVIRDGKRVFVPAGETEGGIARSAIFDRPTIELKPGESTRVNITLTVPPQPLVRAVVAIFHGQTALPGKGALMFTGSLGALITYNLSENIAVRAAAPAISPQTESSNLTVSEQLKNQGHEPVIPKGTLAILNESGELIGRVAIEPHRLLPGEEFNFLVEYPRTLRPGKYRGMMSFEHEGGVQTSNIEFQVLQ